MEIPEACRGKWRGVLHDKTRSSPYSCVVELHATGGTTRYNQSHGRGEGILELTEEPLVLREQFVGPGGGRAEWTLSVSLNDAGHLQCHWRRGPGLAVSATLRRWGRGSQEGAIPAG
jgi:hypothetical protein